MNSRHNKRSRNHDYYSPCKYLITLNKSESVENFGEVYGDIDAPKGSANYPDVNYTRIGKIIARQIKNMPMYCPGVKIYRYVVMPDHIHFVVNVTKKTGWHLGSFIGRFRHFVCERAGFDPFLPGYNDKIIYANRSLDDVIQYVIENPYRLALRRAERAFFRRCDAIRLNGELYTGYGNLELLRDPFKNAVIIHRRYTAKEREVLSDSR